MMRYHTHPPLATIEVDELRAMLERHEPVTMLDVRAAADRAEWSIPGSRHVDAYEALKAGDPDALAEVDLLGGAPVVTVCGAGKASLVAAEQLRIRGISARSLVGGMKAWSLAWNRAEVPLSTGMARVIQIRRTGKGCLSYLIGSNGEAAVIDAAADPSVYQDLASRHGWRITQVLDTHVHATTSVGRAGSPRGPGPRFACRRRTGQPSRSPRFGRGTSSPSAAPA